MPQLSRQAIAVYIPIINKIRAGLEVRLQDPRMEERTEFSTRFLEDAHSATEIAHATSIIKGWLNDPNFDVQWLATRKLNSDAKWSKLLQVIEIGIQNYSNLAAVIELTASQSTGRITRKIHETVLTKDFEPDSNKLKVILALAKERSYIQTPLLQKISGSKNPKSFTNEIGQLNTQLGKELQLPTGDDKRVIEGKKGSGYRINPLYNFVIID